MAITFGKKRQDALSFAVVTDNMVACWDAQQSTGSLHWPDACVSGSAPKKHTSFYGSAGGTWGKFNTGSRNIQNMGGTTQNSGGPTLNTETYNNKNKVKYFTFDGSNDWFCTTQTSISAYSGSIVAWIRMDSSSTMWVLSHHSGGPINIGYGAMSGKMNVWHYTGAPGFQQHQSTGSISGDKWRQVVWTYDSMNQNDNKFAMYIDGDLDHEKGLSWYTASQFPGNIGAIGRNHSGKYWNGDIAYLAMYADALTASEVSKMFQAQRHRFRV